MRRDSDHRAHRGASQSSRSSLERELCGCGGFLLRREQGPCGSLLTMAWVTVGAQWAARAGWVTPRRCRGGASCATAGLPGPGPGPGSQAPARGPRAGRGGLRVPGTWLPIRAAERPTQPVLAPRLARALLGPRPRSHRRSKYLAARLVRRHHLSNSRSLPIHGRRHGLARGRVTDSARRCYIDRHSGCDWERCWNYCF